MASGEPTRPTESARAPNDATSTAGPPLERLFHSMLNGLAHCRMRFGNDGAPEDFLYLAVNPAFEVQTGLRGVAGKWVSEVIPGIRAQDPDLFERYGRVAKGGPPERFEMYLTALGEWFDVSVYSPAAGEFVAVFDVITGRKEAQFAAHRAEAQLLNALHLAHAGHWEYDVASDTFTFNDQFYRVYRTTAEAVGTCRMSSREYAQRFCHPEDAHLVEAETKAAVESPEGPYFRRVQHRALFADGEIGHIAVSFFAEKDESGKTLKTFGVNQDVTDQVRDRASLKAATEMLMETQRAAHAGGWSWDVASGKLTWTEELFRIFGLPEDSTPSFDRWRSVLHPEDLAAAEQRIHDAVQSRTVLQSEYRILLPSGEVRWIEAIGKAAYAGDGTPTRMLGLCLDITERRAAAEVLRDFKDRLDFALERSHTGGWDLDLVDHTAFRTREHDRIFGYPEPLPSWTYEDFLGHVLPEDREAVDQAFQSAIRDRTNWDFECRIRRVDGEIRWIKASGGHRIGTDGRPRRMAGIVQDITAGKAAEQARRSLEEQVNHLQRLESIGRLAGGVAHDMNNVLAAIMSVATLMHRRGEPEERQADLILQACLRGRNLVRGLLDFSRKEVTDFESVDLNRLVAEEDRLLTSTSLSKFAIKLELQEHLPPVQGSRTALANALMNLCVNAIDAMPSGGTLTLRTHCRPGWVQMDVQDTGIGMGPEVQARALEPFYTTKPQGKGTGLGLSMVYGTVTSHGGSIDLDSTPGSGTVVRISLPVEQAGSNSGAGDHAAGFAVESKNLRILLVDDDDLIRQTTFALLEILGHRVTAVPGGAEALEEAAQAPDYDVVLLDQNMPRMTGLETLQRLRGQGCEMPVLLSTGYADEQLKEGLARLGKVLLLPKPFTLIELERALATWS